MRIIEITNQSRKILKKLANAYLSFLHEQLSYSELSNLIDSFSRLPDIDIQKEITRLNALLCQNTFDIMSSTDVKSDIMEPIVKQQWLDRF